MEQNLPEGYQKVMPYLILNDANKFISFMKNVFGATEKTKHMRDENIIMHAEIMLDDCTIMIADSTDVYKAQPAGMFIYVENADTTYEKAINEGAISIMAPVNQNYGRSGGVTDPFGNVWWITSVINK